ncbi:MAG TPA: sugar phosphate isomerase/epimerase family protein [Alphaproteobacteria bacterium]|nr:sugar phosphate isomerase/epimerase family protein [Alphaproteobacteria bacterium]
MRIALCNEVLRELPLDRQVDLASRLGYDGLELAPFTLGAEPHRLPSAERQRVRRLVADAGLQLVGLHWLLITPAGLSITSADATVRARTLEVLCGLVDLCAELGGKLMIHGSPQQRRIAPGEDRSAARARAIEAIAMAAERARQAGLVYCLEPQPPASTEFVNSLAEAAGILADLGNPALKTMIDTCAAANSESESVPALIQRWLARGVIAHIQLNDRNGRAPGQGSDDFAPVILALERGGYDGAVSVEPFVYEPDGPTTAARAIGYLSGILAALRT